MSDFSYVKSLKTNKHSVVTSYWQDFMLTQRQDRIMQMN